MSILDTKTVSVQDLHLLMRLEKMLTMGEIRGLKHMFKSYKGEGTFVGNITSHESGVPNCTSHTALRILTICGVVRKRGCGREGTFVRIIKPEILISLIELEQN